MRNEPPDAETDTYDHIPWSQLTLTNGPVDRGKWMYLAAGLLAVAAIAAVIARVVWQPEVAIAEPSNLPSTPATAVSPPTTAGTVLYSEADLLAASPPRDVEQGVVAAAERYVRQWAASAGSSWTYVEWIAVERTEDLGEGLFRAIVVMQLLHGGEEGTVRAPVEAAEVMLQVDGGAISVVDLPSPTPLDSLVVGSHEVDRADVPDAVAVAARAAVADWGTGTIVGGGVTGGRWRIELTVESEQGLVRTVAVWLSPDGTPLHPVP